MKTTIKSTQVTTFAAIFSLVTAIASNAFAGSATWKASPATDDWTTATNWTPQTIPSAPSDVATFATSNVTSVSVSVFIEVDSIVFNPGASAFAIESAGGLGFEGAGIVNNSGTTQHFVAGSLNFFNSATAGSDTAFTIDGGQVSGAAAGFITFDSQSTAANGTFTIDGGEASGATGGTVFFTNHSGAGAATLIANGGVNGGGGGLIHFEKHSRGGLARLELFGNGSLDISAHATPGLAIGSLQGSGGVVYLGGSNLTVGSNNRTTTFSGVMQDGGPNNSQTGGSLTKIGKGKLTLTAANTYTGGTIIDKGTLVLKNTSGSATGSGPVQVNSGTLSGTGIINGAVTVGNGTTAGAILQPGVGTMAGTLTINNTVSFNPTSAFKCYVNRSATPVAAKLAPLGVTIGTNVSFELLETGTTTLTPGTVFTVINNTSANPISGTFSNLPDGGTITSSNGTVYKANYSGGTGNDLTLTVQ